MVKLELEEFAEEAPHRIRSLQARLRRGSFKFEAAKGVPIPKIDEYGRKTGKFRPIVLAPVESRIVQRAILNVLMEVPALEPFTRSAYSFGGIRKTAEKSTARERRPRSENPSAVPAAIKAVLASIQDGARYVATADIRAFFTRIPKPAVLKIIGDAVKDEEFADFVSRAIDVELSNMAALREKAAEFPIEDIGVAQGNSLSPILGNMILANFDSVMNNGDCRCLRYIDDFIILAPSERAANARLRQAVAVLRSLGMTLSPEKSSRGSIHINDGFDFLGINIAPGLIRPTAKAQRKFLASLDTVFSESCDAMFAVEKGQPLPRVRSLLATLKRADGMIDGWGKHYWFCNDAQSFAKLDHRINDKIRAFLGTYRDVRNRTADGARQELLGVSRLAASRREPFEYPSIYAD